MKQIEIYGGYYEKMTSRKEAEKLIEDIKSDCTWGGVDDGLYNDNMLFVEYQNGEIVIIGEGEPVANLKKTGIKRLILDADWGTTYYNAYPQLDESYPDMPMIRIAAEPGTYGKPYKM